MEEGRRKLTDKIRSVRDLVVYKKAFDAAMEIFESSKCFPKEELYSLTDRYEDHHDLSVRTSQKDGVSDHTKQFLSTS